MGIMQDKMDATKSESAILIDVQFSYTQSSMEFGV